jgi:cytochrome b involved in lipid metabolism
MSRREITLEEVAKHDKEDDCWLLIHDLIVDLPKDFLEEHPGGPDVITCLAGKDATADYEDIAHSDSAREWTSKYIIGWKEGADEEAKTKMIPSASEVAKSGGGGGAGALIPALIVLILAVVAYFVLNQ